MNTITLTPLEQSLAGHVGVMREVASLQRDRGQPDGRERERGFLTHTLGVCGEIVVAKWLGCYWEPKINAFGSSGDVGRFEVRTSHRSDLVIRPADAEDRVVIGVSGYPPVFNVLGWIVASEARQDRYWQTYNGRPGAWFVPAAELRTMETLEVAT